jgi:tetratricopeptide (TPR) repeat protein
MLNHEDKEVQEANAIKLIDQAENLADKGKGNDAINLYEKAAQIYLDLGSYIKLDELFIRITSIISQFKNNIQATYRLKSIIRKTEELKIYEISAKLLVQLGNISYRMKDWETAGESWSKASEYLYETDPEEYLNLSSILLLKAGQSYERAPQTKDLGKELIFRSVMKINKFHNLYQEEEKRTQDLISTKQFEAAADKFFVISTYFKKALSSLDEILSDVDSKDTILNAKARFIHFIAEYQTVSAICLAASSNPDKSERITELGNDSIKLFQESISLLKDYLSPKKSDFDREIILRVTFDTMLLAIVQRIIETDLIQCSKYLLKDIEDNKSLIKQIKNSPYFKITKKIEKVGLTDTLNDLFKVNLGHFEKIKNTLISHFLK